MFPKILGGFQRVDFESFPPRDLIAGLMKLPMAPAAKLRCEFITDLETNRAQFWRNEPKKGIEMRRWRTFA